MTLAQRRQLAALGQPLQRAVASCFQQAKANTAAFLLPVQETGVHQRRQTVQQERVRVGAGLAWFGDGLDHLQRRSAREDGQTKEQRLRLAVEQVVAPAQRALGRLLPCRQVVPATRQGVRPPLEEAQQSAGWQHRGLRRRELQHQRQPIQTRAKPRDRVGIVRRERELWEDGARAGDIELHGRRLRHDSDGDLPRYVWRRQRPQTELLLPAQTQRGAARGQDREAGASAEEVGHEGGGGQEVLKVIQ